MQGIVDMHCQTLRALEAGALKITEDDSELKEWGKEFAKKLVSPELVTQFPALNMTIADTIPPFEGGHQCGCDRGYKGTRRGANCDIGTRCGHGLDLDRLGRRRTHAAIGQDHVRRKRGEDVRGRCGGKSGSRGCEGG